MALACSGLRSSGVIAQLGLTEGRQPLSTRNLGSCDGKPPDGGRLCRYDAKASKPARKIDVALLLVDQNCRNSGRNCLHIYVVGGVSMSVPCGRDGQVGAGLSESVKGLQGWRSVGVEGCRDRAGGMMGAGISRQLE